MCIKTIMSTGDSVVISVAVTDSLHYAGGPFCCIIRVKSKDDSVALLNIDFITANIYGVLYSKKGAIACSKFQSNLQFPFLSQERQVLDSNEKCMLIFTSDTCIYYPKDEADSPQRQYVFKCTIPPFIPPSFTSKFVSCRYFVYIAAQSSSQGGIKLRNTKLEVNIAGSLYPEIPILPFAHFPILPRNGGIVVKGNLVAHDQLETACLEITSQKTPPECLWFDFGLDATTSYQENGARVKRCMIYKDLNTIWNIWDTLQLECQIHGIKGGTNALAEEFARNIQTLDFKGAKSREKLQRLLSCLIPSDVSKVARSNTTTGTTTSNTTEEASPQEVNQSQAPVVQEILCNLLNKLQVRTSPPVTLSRVENVGFKELSFSCEGKRICTCKISGVNEMVTRDEQRPLVLQVNSWFSITFDFSMAECQCLEVDVQLLQVVVLNSESNNIGFTLDTESRHPIITRTCNTCNHRKSSQTYHVPVDTCPSFTSDCIALEYRLELSFHCISVNVGGMGATGSASPTNAAAGRNPAPSVNSSIVAIRRRLHQVKSIKWRQKVVLIQSNASVLSKNHTTTSPSKHLCDHLGPPNVFGAMHTQLVGKINM